MKDRQARTGEARQKLEEIRGVLSHQKARKDSLEEILSHRAYTTESVKRLFSVLNTGTSTASVRPVSWRIRRSIRRELEKACEEFLHEELEYVVVGG